MMHEILNYLMKEEWYLIACFTKHNTFGALLKIIIAENTAMYCYMRWRIHCNEEGLIECWVNCIHSLQCWYTNSCRCYGKNSRCVYMRHFPCRSLLNSLFLSWIICIALLILCSVLGFIHVIKECNLWPFYLMRSVVWIRVTSHASHAR